MGLVLLIQLAFWVIHKGDSKKVIAYVTSYV